MAATADWPRISIVIPSYNQGQYLPEALDSIFRQDYPAAEVIVMDGGSTDDSVAVIHRYAPRLKYWRSERDGGQSAAVNEGMKHATGEVVAWLNSDDYYWGDCLWTVADAWRRYPDRGLYFGNGFRYEQGTGQFTPWTRRHVVLNRQALIHGIDYVLQPATFFGRRAWEEVGGLDVRLHFPMDWDVIIRIARRFPAVVLSDFVAVAREYDEAKTRSGKLKRALELCEVARRYSDCEVTTGSVHNLFSILIEASRGTPAEELCDDFGAGRRRIEQRWRRDYGHHDGFPVTGDPQDQVYLPLPAEVHVRKPAPDAAALPAVSVVCTGEPGAALDEAIASVRGQGYAHLEVVLPTPGAGRRGTAAAVNEGLASANGAVLGYLRGGDLLAEGTLHEVGKAFADDPDLDLVYGNALYVDENDRLRLVEQAGARTAFCYGEVQPADRLPQYWAHPHAVAQPTVFFRRRLAELAGSLDESYRQLFDVEWWCRFAPLAKVRKIERTLAVCRRTEDEARQEEHERQVEWYRFSRSRWPRVLAPGWPGVLGGFVRSYVRQRFGPRARSLGGWATAAAVGTAALLRVGNPETWRVGDRGARAI
jgi:hypothetical protein